MANPGSLAGLKNLAMYSHVSSVGLNNKAEDPNYHTVLQKDIQETASDNVWLRKQLTQVLVSNELLRYSLRHVPTEAQRKQVLEQEKARRLQVEQREWQDQVARLQQLELDRAQMEEEFQENREADRRWMAEVRRKRDEELRLIASTKRRLQEMEELEHAPPRGRLPDPGYLVAISVMFLEKSASPETKHWFFKVLFDVAKSESRQTKKVTGHGMPTWDETLPVLKMPPKAKKLLFELYEEDEDKMLGRGVLDLRSPENEVLPLDILDEDNHLFGRLILRFFSQSPHPLPMPPGGFTMGGSSLDLQIVQGRDLVVLDRNRALDSYVQLCWGAENIPFYNTKTAKGRNPVWNEGFTNWPVPAEVEFVSVYVWDKATTGNNFLGYLRINLNPAPNGEFWVPLYPREGNAEDLKLLEKANDDLGELNIRAQFTYGSGTAGTHLLQDGVPTRCLVTITGVEGIASSEGKPDPYVTMAVGETEASSIHQISPLWNPTFELFVPERETVLHFAVYDDKQIGSDSFLGQADFDVRPTTRMNRSYRLPLQPRPGNLSDKRRSMQNNGLGTINFQTEWVGLENLSDLKEQHPTPPQHPIRPPASLLPPGYPDSLPSFEMEDVEED